MLVVNINEVTLLAPIVDKYFRCPNDYRELMDTVANECIYPEDTLFEFFSYIVVTQTQQIEKMFDLFFAIPYEQMVLYTKIKPIETLERAKSLCPPVTEGPYPWQTILAQWRLSVLQY